MRIADSMRYQQATRHLSNVRSQHAEASQRALTGRRLRAPSDDPLAAVELAQLRSRGAQVNGYQKAIDMVRGDAELSEGMLAQAGSLMQQVRDLATQGASDQVTAQQRQHLAEQVRGLKDQILSAANARGSRGYIFAGSQTDAPAFDDTGAFLGDDEAHNVDVGASSAVRVNSSGLNAFTAAGGRDIFADLDALATALESDDGAGVRASLDDIAAGHDQIQAERGRAGLRLNRLETSQTALERVELLVAQQDEAVGGADQIEAYSDFVTLGQALERAIGVSRQLLSLGSLNQF